MLKILLPLLLAASQAWAGRGSVQYGAPLNGAGESVNPISLTTNLISGATVFLNQNGAVSGVYPNAPVSMTGNINSYLQAVLQNQSNGANASGCYVLTNDLGNDSQFFGEMCINSSKYSQAAFSVQPSSAVSIDASDSGLYLWADTNGAGALGNSTGHVIIGSSAPVTGNVAMDISSASVTIATRTFITGPITTSSATFVGLEVSTVAAGSAGTSVTVLCNQGGNTPGLFAVGGGCNCSGAVGETANISTPNVITPGGIATGWTCQIAGGTGGACSAFVICSRLQ